MNLSRILEPEVMDSADEAAIYDSMDHSEVNRRFVDDLLAVDPDWTELLDLGTGTARIPIEICRRVEEARVLAVDLSIGMLDVARINVELARLLGHIKLDRIDAKQLPYSDGRFSCVISNSIIHHIPQPEDVLTETVRVTASGGTIFVRDLMRPDSEAKVAELIEMYTGDEPESAQTMFADSLRAALSLDEIRSMVEALGFAATSVQATSDRHWTWHSRREGST